MSLTTSVSSVATRTGDVVFQLLREGLDAMAENRATATDCIQRAYALLESERDRAETGAPERARGSLVTWQIRRVTSFIEDHLEQSITHHDLAPLVRLSPQYFAYAFKLTFGVTPLEYIYQRRLELAQVLMLTTDEPLSQIARSCGFADQAHFTRRFRASFDATPNAWRVARLGSYRVAA